MGNKSLLGSSTGIMLSQRHSRREKGSVNKAKTGGKKQRRKEHDKEQLIMSERMAENEVRTVLGQLGQEEKSRGGGEGEERVKAEEEDNVADFLALKHEQIQEDNEESAECQVPASKNKPGRVQSVFCLVRDQIRGQPGREGSRTGMLQLVQQVTRQLDRTKVEQEVLEDALSRKEVQEPLEVQEEIQVDLKNDQAKEESKKDDSVVVLQQILNSIEGLRKEVGEELNLLRLESQNNMDKVLRELETRLTDSLNTNVNTNTPASVPPLSGAPRRRILRRTLTTTMVPKNSTAQAFRPRCMSEPVGGRKEEIAGTGSNTLPVSSLEPLLPSLVVMQQAKKPVRSKARTNKPAS